MFYSTVIDHLQLSASFLILQWSRRFCRKATRCTAICDWNLRICRRPYYYFYLPQMLLFSWFTTGFPRHCQFDFDLPLSEPLRLQALWSICPSWYWLFSRLCRQNKTYFKSTRSESWGNRILDLFSRWRAVKTEW